MGSLKEQLQKALGKWDKFVLRCCEYKRLPLVGKIIFENTKGHPCSCCNRPQKCRITI